MPHCAGILGFHDNEYTAKLVKQYPNRIIGYASVHPVMNNALDELRRGIEDYGLKGLKLHPPIQNFSMLDPLVGPIIEACIDYDIPILVHTGPVYAREARMVYSNSMDIDELAIRYPQAKLIIAHGHPFGIDPGYGGKTRKRVHRYDQYDQRIFEHVSAAC